MKFAPWPGSSSDSWSLPLWRMPACAVSARGSRLDFRRSEGISARKWFRRRTRNAERDRFTQRDIPPGTAGDLPVIGPAPTLIQSSDFPIAVGQDGSLYYPQADGDRVKIMRVNPGSRPALFASLPPIQENRPDGESKS